MDALVLLAPLIASIVVVVAWRKGRRWAAVSFLVGLVAAALAALAIGTQLMGFDRLPDAPEIVAAVAGGVLLVLGVVGALLPAKPTSSWARSRVDANEDSEAEQDRLVTLH